MEYPKDPGYQNTDTSKAAAVSMKGRVATIQEAVVDCLELHGRKATFELAALLGKSYRSVQPRTSELRLEGRIKDTGERRIDPDTGRKATVWGLA